MEEDENVVKGGFEFVRQHAQLDVVAYHGKNVLLHHDKPLARQP